MEAKNSKMAATRQEYIEFLKFVDKNTTNTNAPINVQQLSQDFVKETKTKTKADTLKYRVICSQYRICEFEEFDWDTKVKLIFGFGHSLNSEELAEVRQYAHVKLDLNGKIIHYESKKLNLHGKPEPRKRGLSDLSNLDGETYEEDYDYDEWENLNGSPKRQKMDEDQTSLQNVLEALHTLLLTLDLNALEGVQKKIEEQIEEVEVTEEKISVHKIQTALNPCLALAEKSPTAKSEESMRLREFLLLIRHTVIGMEIPVLDGFQKKLKGFLDKLAIRDKKVPIASIQNALESTVNLLIR